MKVKVINGPNLNTTGRREPDKYGTETLDMINERIRKRGEELGVEVEFFQSNSEGALITEIQQSWGLDGVIINAGGYTHYSIAVRDAITGTTSTPFIEVHMTNIYSREGFRRVSLIAEVCKGSILGLGGDGYILALEALVMLKKRQQNQTV
jgi:3-dehydroquinate dehydratase-2